MLIFVLVASMGFGSWPEVHHSLYIWMRLQHEGKMFLLLRIIDFWNMASSSFHRKTSIFCPFFFFERGSTQFILFPSIIVYLDILLIGKFTGGIDLWKDRRMEI